MVIGRRNGAFRGRKVAIVHGNYKWSHHYVCITTGILAEMPAQEWPERAQRDSLGQRLCAAPGSRSREFRKGLKAGTLLRGLVVDDARRVICANCFAPNGAFMKMGESDPTPALLPGL